MSKPPPPEATVSVLSKPHPAVITTLRPDGQPVSAATWYLRDEGRALVDMDEDRTRLGHLRDDPRVTLTVLDGHDWYTHVTLIGRVTELRDDADLADIDRSSRHYPGGPYTKRDRARVSGWIEIDRRHGWGAHKANDQAAG